MNAGDRLGVWSKLNILVALIFVVSFTLFLSSASYTATETISISSLSIKLGDTGMAGIAIDYLPNGLSGYIIILSLSNTKIAVISDIKFTAFDGANEVSISPDGSSVTFSAIDIDDAVKPGATKVDLARIKLQGIAEGVSTIHITVKMMTDDDGNAIQPDIADGQLQVLGTRPPLADFSFSPSEPTDLDVIQFTDQSTDPDGEVVSWKWDFGDGKTSNERNPSHRYSDDGTYTVSLTVTDEDRATHKLTKEIKISNVAPTAEFTFSPVEPHVNQRVEFDASKSKDPDGKIVSYEWDWDNNGTFDEIANSPISTRSFADPGDYTVVLRVIDDDGDNNAISHTVTVKVINRPPNASFTFSPENPKVNQRITFDASSSSDVDGSIILYEWKWNTDQSFESSATFPKAYHSFAHEGNYQVTLRVTDNHGATVTATKTVSVIAPKLPIAHFEFSPLHPKEGQSTLFNAASSYDPDGKIVEYAWDFNNDGRIEKRTTDPVTKYTFNSSGKHQVRLIVSDSNNLTDEIIQQVEVFPSLPPFFVSAGVAPSNVITIMEGGLGIPLSNDLIGHVSVGFGSGSITRKGFGATVNATAIGVSFLYRVSKNIFVGPGGGLILLRGQYHIDWPTSGSKSFSREVPVLSLSLGMSFGSVLVAASLHVILV